MLVHAKRRNPFAITKQLLCSMVHNLGSTKSFQVFDKVCASKLGETNHFQKVDLRKKILNLAKEKNLSFKGCLQIESTQKLLSKPTCFGTGAELGSQ